MGKRIYVPVGLAFLLIGIRSAAAQQDLRPDTEFTIDMADLGKTLDDNKDARVGVYLPKNYTLERSFPAVVYLDGGYGGSSPRVYKEITDGKDWVVLAVPYMAGYFGRDGRSLKEKGADLLAWIDTLLGRVWDVVPNVDREQMVISGMSTGGGAFAVMLNLLDEQIPRKYCGAVQAGLDGPSSDSFVQPYSQGWPLLVVCGAGDVRVPGLRIYVEKMKKSTLDVTYAEVEGMGHPWHRNAYPAVRRFLTEKVLKRNAGLLAKRLEKAKTAREWGEVARLARSVIAATPEGTEQDQAKTLLEEATRKGAEQWEELAGGTDTNGKLEFARAWAGSDLGKKAAGALADTAQTEFAALTKRKPSRVKLQKFVHRWQGFEVGRQAMTRLETDAALELEKIEKRRIDGLLRCRYLAKFAKDWDPAPSARKALARREQVAQELLDTARKDTNRLRRARALALIARELKDTAAGKAAANEGR